MEPPLPETTPSMMNHQTLKSELNNAQHSDRMNIEKNFASLSGDFRALCERLELIERHLGQINSVKQTFLFSIVRGFGYAIGATVVVSIVATILVRTLDTIDYVPIVSQFFNSAFFQQIQLELEGLQ